MYKERGRKKRKMYVERERERLLPSYVRYNSMESTFPSIHFNNSNTIDDFIHYQYSLISQLGCIQSVGQMKRSIQMKCPY